MVSYGNELVGAGLGWQQALHGRRRGLPSFVWPKCVLAGLLRGAPGSCWAVQCWEVDSLPAAGGCGVEMQA
jgi:hypothetical protein